MYSFCKGKINFQLKMVKLLSHYPKGEYTSETFLFITKLFNIEQAKDITISLRIYRLDEKNYRLWYSSVNYYLLEIENEEPFIQELMKEILKSKNMRIRILADPKFDSLRYFIQNNLSFK